MNFFSLFSPPSQRRHQPRANDPHAGKAIRTNSNTFDDMINSGEFDSKVMQGDAVAYLSARMPQSDAQAWARDLTNPKTRDGAIAALKGRGYSEFELGDMFDFSNDAAIRLR